MAFSFGQGLLDLAQNNGYWAALSFEKSQAIPKAYDFSLSCRVHGRSLAGRDICTVNEKRTKCKTLMVGPANGRGH
jgi:hypothetical protein